MNVNLWTRRRAPSRYLYPLHLFQPKAGAESRFDQFLQDIRQDPPALIIGPKVPSSDLPFITGPTDQPCPGCIPEAARGLEEFKAYVDAHYSIVSDDGTMVIYQYVH